MGVLLKNLFQVEGINATLGFKMSIEKETYDNGEVKYKINTDEWNNDVNSRYMANTEVALTLKDLMKLKEVIDHEIENGTYYKI